MTGATQSVPLLGHARAVYSVAFSPSEDLLATAGQDGTVRRWRSSDGMPVGDSLSALDPYAQFTSVSFNPQGTVLAASASSGATYLWDAKSADPILDTPIATDQGVVYAVCFVRGGTQLATAGEDGTIRYWSATDGSAAGPPVAAQEGAIERFVCSQDGMRLASSGDDGGSCCGRWVLPIRMPSPSRPMITAGSRWRSTRTVRAWRSPALTLTTISRSTSGA